MCLANLFVEDVDERDSPPARRRRRGYVGPDDSSLQIRVRATNMGWSTGTGGSEPVSDSAGYASALSEDYEDDVLSSRREAEQACSYKVGFSIDVEPRAGQAGGKRADAKTEHTERFPIKSREGRDGDSPCTLSSPTGLGGQPLRCVLGI